MNGVPLTETPLPYGLRDVKLTPNTNGTLGTAVDLPNAQTLSFEETEDFETLRGDDRDVATRGKGPAVNWSLESGGVSLEALAALTGGTVASTGTTPAQVKTFTKKSTDARPTFQVEGQSMSESGGDFHAVLPRCKVTGSITGDMADGAFWISKADGTAIGNYSTDDLFKFVQNETAVDIDES